MVSIHVRYTGDLHCEAVHTPSGTALSTDAPKDNQGRGESFSPTDLLATALGSCMLTIMGITARSLGVNMDNAHAEVTKIMSAVPRRIAQLTVTLTMPAGIPPTTREKLEQAAHACPVHKSLHPDTLTLIGFIWK
jgi:putative redox protein